VHLVCQQLTFANFSVLTSIITGIKGHGTSNDYVDWNYVFGFVQRYG
jgi:hypothetical protein